MTDDYSTPEGRRAIRERRRAQRESPEHAAWVAAAVRRAEIQEEMERFYGSRR